MITFKLSPSDLTFLWDECKRCFYLKVVHSFDRPRLSMPSVFIRLDGLMKGFFKGRLTGELTSLLPEGYVQFAERWVQSRPISLPGHAAQCYLMGKFDTVVAFRDGSYGIVDFKTSEAKPQQIAFYGRQLHAYAYALENPAPGKLSLSPVSRLGLLVVEPRSIEKSSADQIAYLGKVTWQEVPRDDQSFLGFLGDVLTVLEQPVPPPAAEECSYCRYRDSARQTGW